VTPRSSGEPGLNRPSCTMAQVSQLLRPHPGSPDAARANHAQEEGLPGVAGRERCFHQQVILIRGRSRGGQGGVSAVWPGKVWRGLAWAGLAM
jgi:hypothetical protein